MTLCTRSNWLQDTQNSSKTDISVRFKENLIGVRNKIQGKRTLAAILNTKATTEIDMFLVIVIIFTRKLFLGKRDSDLFFTIVLLVGRESETVKFS